MVAHVADKEEKPAQSAACSDTTSESDVLDAVRSVLNELYRLSCDRIRLAALETRRAGESLVAMIVAAVMLAFMLSSAWLGLMAATVLAMMDNGVAVISAILLAVAVNLFLTLILCRVIRYKCFYLQFPATLRSLKVMDSDRHVTKKP